jgi:hypothetical protein
MPYTGSKFLQRPPSHRNDLLSQIRRIGPVWAKVIGAILMIQTSTEVCYVSRGTGILPEKVTTRFVTIEENGKVITRIDLQVAEKIGVNQAEFVSSAVVGLQRQ